MPLKRFQYAIVCLLTICSSCTLELNYRDNTPPVLLGCDSNAACPSGSQCTLGTCLSQQSPQGTYRLRLIPTETSTVREFDLLDIRFGQQSFMELPAITVPASLKTSGAVRTNDGQSISADIIAIGSSENDAVIRVETSTVFEANRPTFMMWLPTQSQTMTGTTRPLLFDLHVLPSDRETLPPFVLQAIEATSVTPPFFIDLPDREELRSVTGQILINTLDSLPALDLQVMLFNEAGRRISTIAKTEPDGRFQIQTWVQSSGISATLVIQSSERNLPRIEHGFELSPNDGIQDLGTFSLGFDEQFFELAGIVQGDTGIKGASVALEAAVGSGTVSASLPTALAHQPCTAL